MCNYLQSLVILIDHLHPVPPAGGGPNVNVFSVAPNDDDPITTDPVIITIFGLMY